MARVIVILALMLLISALIFGLTRKPAGGVGSVDAEARATVPLSDSSLADSHAADALHGNAKGNSAQTAEVSTAQDVMSGLVAGAAPAFSTVGVDNRGRASFTGTASPGDDITILHAGKPLGRSMADRTGSWTVDFRVPSVREDYELVLSARRTNGQTVSGPQRAVVSPPETSGGLPRITLKSTEVRTTSSTPETATKATTPEPDVGIVIEKADGGADGTAVLRGRSDPGASLSVMIAGRKAGETKVGADGKWVLAVRNDAAEAVSGVLLVLQSAGGKELDRAEVPLRISAGKSLTASSQTQTPAAAVQDQARGHTRGTGRYVRVRRGDSLWRISRRYYGNGRHWKQIYKANRHKLHDADFLVPGRRIYLPG